MLNSRLIRGLLVCSLLLIGLVLFLLYRQVPHSQDPYAKAVDKADKIALQQGPEKLELDQQGKDWQVKTPQGALLTTDSEKVKTLLTSLREVQVEDEITDRADRAADYEVTSDSGIRVTLLSKTATLADGVFGKQAPDFTHIYFRFPDKPSIYLARGVIRGELGRPAVNDWRSRQLIDMPETKIQGILMEGPGFKTELVRTSTDVWTLNGKIVETGPVNVLVGILAHLQASDFVDPAAFPNLNYEGLKNARVVVKSVDSTVELRIGSEDAKSKRYPVSTSQQTGLAWITESQGKMILKNPADFKSAGK